MIKKPRRVAFPGSLGLLGEGSRMSAEQGLAASGPQHLHPQGRVGWTPGSPRASAAVLSCPWGICALPNAFAGGSSPPCLSPVLLVPGPRRAALHFSPPARPLRTLLSLLRLLLASPRPRQRPLAWAAGTLALAFAHSAAAGFPRLEGLFNPFSPGQPQKEPRGLCGRYLERGTLDRELAATLKFYLFLFFN